MDEKEFPDVIVITGPTAAGKTALGVALAKRVGGEIVSADSMQVYRHMDIGTAKPTRDEMGGIPHHMIGVAAPREDYSVARYVAEAVPVVDDIIGRGRTPLIVGGTGLYIDSLIAGREFSRRGDKRLRDELSDRFDKEGGAAMLQELRQIDPERAGLLHENDKKRVVRALEIFYLTGKTITEHDELTRAGPDRYNALKIGLQFADRADLYERIDSRVDRMVGAGLEDEVRGLLRMGLTAENTAMAAIGYKEMAEGILAGTPIRDIASMIKTESRRYAKRQLSWLRRDLAVKWIYWKKIPDFVWGVNISTKYLEEKGYNVSI